MGNEHGFGLVGILMIVVVVVALGGGSAYVWHKDHKTKTPTVASKQTKSSASSSSISKTKTQPSQGSQQSRPPCSLLSEQVAQQILGLQVSPNHEADAEDAQECRFDSVDNTGASVTLNLFPASELPVLEAGWKEEATSAPNLFTYQTFNIGSGGAIQTQTTGPNGPNNGAFVEFVRGSQGIKIGASQTSSNGDVLSRLKIAAQHIANS